MTFYNHNPEYCYSGTPHEMNESQRFPHPEQADKYIVNYRCVKCGYMKQMIEDAPPFWDRGCPTCEE